MAIESTPCQKTYKVICTDPTCQAELTFSHSDIEVQYASCIGQRVYRGRGISCPECRQIITEDLFTETTPTPQTGEVSG